MSFSRGAHFEVFDEGTLKVAGARSLARCVDETVSTGHGVKEELLRRH